MLLTLLLTFVNLLLALLETKLLKIPGFDIAPAAIIILARHDESILLGSLLLLGVYAVLSATKLRYLWITLPLTILIGYLALVVSNVFLLLLLYYVLLTVVAVISGTASGRYWMFLGINLVVNLTIARFL